MDFDYPPTMTEVGEAIQATLRGWEGDPVYTAYQLGKVFALGNLDELRRDPGFDHLVSLIADVATSNSRLHVDAWRELEEAVDRLRPPLL